MQLSCIQFCNKDLFAANLRHTSHFGKVNCMLTSLVSNVKFNLVDKVISPKNL